jgi:molybdenum cofactor cytidylyltransferase
VRLIDTLRLRPGMSVAFTGAGGKSSALATLAREARGEFPIALTTTTRLGLEQRALGDEHVIATSLDQLTRVPLERGRTIVVTGPANEPEGKLSRLEPALLDELARRCRSEGALVAIEADGARRRWVKAPAPHEPVVPAWVDVMVPVVRLQAVGAPLNSETAHRPERIAQVVGVSEGTVLTVEHLAALLTSEEGGMKGAPPSAEVRVLMTGDDASLENDGRDLAERLLGVDRVRASLLADLTSTEPVRSCLGRTAAVILAAGVGVRFGGPKQLAMWKGRPLIAHVIQAAKEGGFSPIVVVLGTHSEEIRRAAADEGIEFAENRKWQDGQSSSVHAGLLAVERRVEAVAFLLGDMPRVSAETMRRLVEAHRTSLPSIVAPVGGGRRGNPVLFDRRVFPSLHALSGDQGGRSLLDRWPWQAIEADPREFAEVDRPDDLRALDRDG